MPLLQGQPFRLIKPPENVEPGTVLYTIQHTGEQFLRKSDYEDRLALYSQSIWTCQCSGKSGMTHQEAWTSEAKVRVMLSSSFPPALLSPVLHCIHHSTQSLDQLVETASMLCNSRYHPGEELTLLTPSPRQVRVLSCKEEQASVGTDYAATSEKPTQELSLLASPTMPLSNGCNNSKQEGSIINGSINGSSSDNGSPSGGMKNKEESPKRKGLLPLLYDVVVIGEDKKIYNVPAKSLQRTYRVPPKEHFRLFIRAHAMRQRASAYTPWIVSDDLVKLHNIPSKLSSVFTNSKFSFPHKKRKLEQPLEGKSKRSKGELSGDSKLKSKAEEKKMKIEAKEEPQRELKQENAAKPVPSLLSPVKQEITLKVEMSDSDDDISLAALKCKSPKTPTSPVMPVFTPPKIKKDTDGEASASQKKLKQATLFDLKLSKKTPSNSVPKNISPKKSPPKKVISPESVMKLPIMRRLIHERKIYTGVKGMARKIVYTMDIALNRLSLKQLEVIPDEGLRDDMLRRRVRLWEKKAIAKLSPEARELYLKKRAEEDRKRRIESRRAFTLKLQQKNQKVEDKILPGLKSLPQPKPVLTPDIIPNSLFGDIAMIVEFIECYKDIVLSDKKTSISCQHLMQALAAGKNGFKFISEIMVLLLHIIIDDERVGNSTELGLKIRELAIHYQTAIELARLCLGKKELSDSVSQHSDENEIYEEHSELSEDLLKKLESHELYDLQPVEIIEVLKALCHRAMSSYTSLEYFEDIEEKALAINREHNILKKEKLKVELEKKKQIRDELKKKKLEKLNSPKKSRGRPKKQGKSIVEYMQKDDVQEDTLEENLESPDIISVVKRKRMSLEEQRKEKDNLSKEMKEKRVIEEEEKRKAQFIQQWEKINSQKDMLTRLQPLGCDRNHDRYWLFNTTTPGLYVEKGWVDANTTYCIRSPSPKKDMSAASQEGEKNIDSVAAALTYESPPKKSPPKRAVSEAVARSVRETIEAVIRKYSSSPCSTMLTSSSVVCTNTTSTLGITTSSVTHTPVNTSPAVSASNRLLSVKEIPLSTTATSSKEGTATVSNSGILVGGQSHLNSNTVKLLSKSELNVNYSEKGLINEINKNGQACNDEKIKETLAQSNCSFVADKNQVNLLPMVSKEERAESITAATSVINITAAENDNKSQTERIVNIDAVMSCSPELHINSTSSSSVPVSQEKDLAQDITPVAGGSSIANHISSQSHTCTTSSVSVNEGSSCKPSTEADKAPAIETAPSKLLLDGDSDSDEKPLAIIQKKLEDLPLSVVQKELEEKPLSLLQQELSPAKRSRGRPPKEKTPGSEVKIPRPRGRPPKEKPPYTPPRPRGRPPKIRSPEEFLLKNPDGTPYSPEKNSPGKRGRPKLNRSLNEDETFPPVGENMWFYYNSLEEVDKLLECLACSGIRESKLKTSISQARTQIEANFITEWQPLEDFVDGSVQLRETLREDIIQIEHELTEGWLGSVPNHEEWEKQASEATNVQELGECLIEAQKHVQLKFFKGIMKPIKKPVPSDNPEAPPEYEEVEVLAVQQWRDAVSSCTTLSRLHLLVGIFDSCIKWEKSLATKKCKVCRCQDLTSPLAVCDKCESSYHWHCLRPQLHEEPPDPWLCSACQPNKNKERRNIIREQFEDEKEEEPLPKERKQEKICRVCERGLGLIYCSVCLAAYHSECHNPPLQSRARKDWKCVDCQRPKLKSRTVSSRGIHEELKFQNAKTLRSGGLNTCGSSRRSAKVKYYDEFDENEEEEEDVRTTRRVSSRSSARGNTKWSSRSKKYCDEEEEDEEEEVSSDDDFTTRRRKSKRAKKPVKPPTRTTSRNIRKKSYKIESDEEEEDDYESEEENVEDEEDENEKNNDDEEEEEKDDDMEEEEDDDQNENEEDGDDDLNEDVEQDGDGDEDEMVEEEEVEDDEELTDEDNEDSIHNEDDEENEDDSEEEDSEQKREEDKDSQEEYTDDDEENDNDKEYGSTSDGSD
ncbi:hypothetical protein SK128_003473 [Halocaridina rubra]|uniref:Uncharacterized protein n=1 Tax=Halocaridina rubra TaxID=373956 RepID=A0AAN9A7T0_HALRR